MGGARCYFRDCNVSTALYPGMHFFHFPVKDRERYLKWLELADVKHFLDMPIMFQKNRNVCARHFRDECFMNYKKNRLVSTKKVLPTLMRLSEDIALDYANPGPDGLPELITLPKPTEPHLIPPQDFQSPLGFDKNAIVLLKDDIAVTEADAANDDKTVARKRQAPHTEIKLLNKVRILNVAAPETKQVTDASAEDTSDSDPEVQYVVQLHEQAALDEQAEKDVGIYEIQESDSEHDDVIPTESGVVKLSGSTDPTTTTDVSVPDQQEEFISTEQHNSACEQLEKLLEAELSAHAAEKLALMTRLQTTTDSLSKKEIELERAQQEAESVRAEHAKCVSEQQTLSHKHAELQCKNAELYEEWANMASELQQLQEAHEVLQQKYATLTEQHHKHQQHQQVATVSTSKETAPTAVGAACSTHSSAIGVTPPTKAQLFNGIKKYISASMTALVRMEMFGQEERAWKPDERRAAIDLLRLGEHVYRYVSDEWRCRLPALRQVRTWLSEEVVDADEEDL